jgi:hypothetical protein
MAQEIYVRKKDGRKKVLFEIKRPGEFTRKAERAGMTVKQFAGAVLANPENYPKRTRRQAATAKGLMAMRRNRNK